MEEQRKEGKINQNQRRKQLCTNLYSAAKVHENYVYSIYINKYSWGPGIRYCGPVRIELHKRSPLLLDFCCICPGTLGRCGDTPCHSCWSQTTALCAVWEPDYQKTLTKPRVWAHRLNTLAVADNCITVIPFINLMSFILNQAASCLRSPTGKLYQKRTAMTVAIFFLVFGHTVPNSLLSMLPSTDKIIERIHSWPTFCWVNKPSSLNFLS